MRAFAEGKTHTFKFANNIQDGGLCYNAGIGVSAILSRKTCIIDINLKKKHHTKWGGKRPSKFSYRGSYKCSQLIEI